MKVSQIVSVVKRNKGLFFAAAAILLVYLRQLFTYKAIWLDEAMLLLSIRDRSWLELFQTPFANFQVAPVGFIVVEKLVGMLPVAQEIAWRLFPFVATLLSIIVFYLILDLLFAQNRRLNIAVALLYAFTLPVVYYAIEAKQYATDLLATMIVLWGFLWFRNQTQLTAKHKICIAALLSCMVMFSQAVLFVLAGVGLFLVGEMVVKKNWDYIKQLVQIFTIPALVAVIHAWFTYQLAGGSATKAFMERVWRGGFLPVQPLSVETILWLPKILFKYVRFIFVGTDFGQMFLLGSIAGIIICILFVVGWFRAKERVAEIRLVFCGVILFLLFASVFKFYPTDGRLLLFLLPFIYLFVGVGLNGLSNQKLSITELIVWVVIGLQFGYLLKTSLIRESSRDVMPFLRENTRSQDAVIMYDYMQFPAMFYDKSFCKSHVCLDGLSMQDAAVRLLAAEKRIFVVHECHKKIDFLKGNGFTEMLSKGPVCVSVNGL